MATKVEKERAKERQLVKMEKKIDQILEMLSAKTLVADQTDEVSLEETKKPKKAKNEK